MLALIDLITNDRDVETPPGPAALHVCPWVAPRVPVHPVRALIETLTDCQHFGRR